jgi:hypothetical protein
VEERRHRSEQFNAVYGAWPWAGSFFLRPLKRWSLQASISHRPIAFVPEGSSLDRFVTLNCGIRGYRQSDVFSQELRKEKLATQNPYCHRALPPGAANQPAARFLEARGRACWSPLSAQDRWRVAPGA